MALDPVDDIDGLTSVADVNKVETAAELKAVVRAFSDANAVRALDLSGRTRILIGDWLYRRDTQDTQADDSVLVVHDYRGNHWLRIAPPASSWMPRGSYSGATVYALNDVVENQNSSWVYINVTPSSGHAPPTLPTKVNTWWQIVAQQGAAGSATSSADVAWTSNTSPAQITADKEDYNPTGLSTAAVIRHDLDAEHAINGFAGGAVGRLMLDLNVSSKTLRLPAERASSSAANRLAGGDVELDPGAAGLRIYDATSQRWRPVGYRRRPLHLHCKPDPFPTIPHKPIFFADFSTMSWLDPGLQFSGNGLRSYFNRKGFLGYAPPGVPRFHTIPSNGETGVLIEGSASKLALNTEDFTAASWTKTCATVSPNVAVAPDGAITADKLVEDTSSNTHLIQAYISGAQNIMNCGSYFVRPAERTRLRLQLNGSSGQCHANFDLATGSLVSVSNGGNASGTIGFIEPLAYGWFWVAVAGIADTTAPGSGYAIVLSLADQAGNVSYAGDGASGLNIWGAGAEVGSFPTSYLPVSAAPVTRVADNFIYMDSAGLINSAEGCLYIKALRQFKDSAATYPVLGQIDSGSSSNRHFIFLNSATNQISYSSSDAGATQFNVASAGAVTYGAAVKAATVWRENDFAGTRNGAAPVTDNSGTVPTGLNRLVIGGAAAGITPFNGLIQEIAILARRPSNAQIQVLTT